MSSQFTIPGKVFVIGEYGALFGGQALLAMLRPGYTYECKWSHEGMGVAVDESAAIQVDGGLSSQTSAQEDKIDNSSSGEFVKIHPASPIGHYMGDKHETLSLKLLKGSMAPGFGSSTAELIAGVHADLERLPEIKRLWAWYRDLYPRTSGADLVAQFEAFRTKKPLFLYEHGDASAVSSSDVASKIEVFQIDETHKLPTHEALKNEVPKVDVAHLNALVKKIVAGFETGSLSDFSALTEFADTLHAAGIETQLANDIRKSFSKVAGVVGVKGCGAGMNDVFLVAGEFSVAARAELQSIAREFKLKALGNLKELLW